MVFSYNANQVPASGAVAIYNLKELLKTSGWVVKSSSDATTYNSVGDQLTTGASGTNGLGNSSAWFRIQCPSMGGVTRELCFQRGSTNALWKIKYSYSAGFTGGSPGTTRVPSATDEQFVLGAGTDASPTYQTLFGADTTYKHHCAAGTSSDGYMFYSVAYPHNAGTLSHLLYMDRIIPSTLHPSDVDGYVFYANNSVSVANSNFHGENAVGTTIYSPQSWLRKGLSNETWASTPALYYQYYTSGGILTFAEKAMGTNAFDGRDTGLPVVYAKATNETGLVSGYKGIGSLMKIASSTRSNGTPLDLNGIRDIIQIEFLLLPWNGTVPII